MRNQEQQMSLRGVGLLRLWTELMIHEGRRITAAQLTADVRARVPGAVQVGTPWAIVLGYDRRDAPMEEARIFSYFGVTVEDVERIGAGDFDLLKQIAEGWGSP